LCFINLSIKLLKIGSQKWKKKIGEKTLVGTYLYCSVGESSGLLLQRVEYLTITYCILTIRLTITVL